MKGRCGLMAGVCVGLVLVVGAVSGIGGLLV